MNIGSHNACGNIEIHGLIVREFFEFMDVGDNLLPLGTLTYGLIGVRNGAIDREIKTYSKLTK